MPITVLVILLIVAFWFVVPIMIVGLFFDFRYYFNGPDIKSTKVNDAMDSVANAAGEIKNDMKK
jgi:cell shape-determining protein MreC